MILYDLEYGYGNAVEHSDEIVVDFGDFTVKYFRSGIEMNSLASQKTLFDKIIKIDEETLHLIEGERIYDLRFGWGVISKISTELIEVSFEKGKQTYDAQGQRSNKRVLFNSNPKNKKKK